MILPKQSPDSSSNAAVNPSGALARRIGLLGLVAYGVGDMLGSGIYALVGKAAGLAGNALWLSFLLSFTAALLTALSYASLGSRYPRAGGAAYVAERAFAKPALSYVLGLSVVASGLTSLATQSRAFGGYLLGLTDIPAEAEPVVAVGFITVLALINFWGIRESTAFNVLCTLIEAAGLFIVVAVGARFWGSVDYFELPVAADAEASSLSLLLGASVLTFYAFIGFEDMINVSEEVKNPRKNFPRAVILAMSIAALIYMAVSITVVSVLPHTSLARSSAPLVDVVQAAAPELPEPLFAVIALFAIANTGLINYIMSSRMIYGLARQALIPAVFGRVHAQRRTPHLAIVGLFVVVLGLALSGNIAELASATSALLLMVFMVVNAAAVALHRRPDEPPGGFEIPVAVPAAGIVASGVLLLHVQAKAWLTALGLIAGILVLYLVLRQPRVVQPPTASGPDTD